MTRERLLIRTLLELADTLVAEYDVVDLLHLLCDRAVEIAGADAAGVLLMKANGQLGVAASTSHAMHRLEEIEAQTMRGPCVEAHRSGEPIDDGDLRASARRWPELAEAAGALGFRSVHADPLLLRSQPMGALSVYRRATGAFDEQDAEVIAGLADMAAIGLNNERAHRDAAEQISNLERALSKRTVVDQATAVLADRLGSDHGAAFTALRRYARDHNQRLRVLAQRFLEGDLGVETLMAADTGAPGGSQDPDAEERSLA